MFGYKNLQNRLVNLRVRLPKASQRQLFVGSVVAVMLLSAIGFAYYSSGSRVLGDAMARLSTAEAVDFNGATTFAFKDGQQSVKIKSEFRGGGTKNKFAMDTKTKFGVGAVDVNVNLGLAADQEAMYFKLANAKELADTLTTTLGKDNPYTKEYQPLADKLDNTWVKVDNQLDSELYGCDFNEINAMAAQDQDALRRIFEQNRFITAERSSWGFTEQAYDLSFNREAAERYAQELMDTEFYKKLENDCGLAGSSSTFPPENRLGDMDISARIWINPWTHKPKRFMLSVKGDNAEFTFEMSVNLGRQTDVTIPSDAIPLERLLQESPQGSEYFFQELIEDQPPDTPASNEVQLDLQSSDLSGAKPQGQIRYPQKLEVRSRPETWE